MKPGPDPILPRSLVSSLEAMLTALDGTDVTSIELEAGALRVGVKRTGVLAPVLSVGPEPDSAAPTAPPLLDPEPIIVAITSELVGRFLLPRPVARGDEVHAGDVVACIESMSLMNDVRAPVAGRIVEILVEPGHPVEYGQVLMALVPGAAPAAAES